MPEEKTPKLIGSIRGVAFEFLTGTCLLVTRSYAISIAVIPAESWRRLHGHWNTPNQMMGNRYTFAISLARAAWRNDEDGILLRGLHAFFGVFRPIYERWHIKWLFCVEKIRCILTVAGFKAGIFFRREGAQLANDPTSLARARKVLKPPEITSAFNVDSLHLPPQNTNTLKTCDRFYVS